MDQPTWRHDTPLAPLDGLDLSYRVASCQACGAAYAADLAPPERYAQYYSQLSKYDLPAQSAALSPLSRARIDAALGFCRAHLRPDSIICDIGCGAGTLLHGLHLAGYTALHGIDPAPASAREAERAFGLTGVKVGTLADAPARLPLGATDLLCLTGVLEHLTDPVRDLAPLISALPEQAHVLIEVPALERFTVEPMEAFGEFSLEHIQYFSAISLDRLMSRLGLVRQAGGIVALQGCTDSLFGLFAKGQPALPPLSPASTDDLLGDYLQRAGQRQSLLESRLRELGGEFFIFGAGSHTARLLPLIDQLGMSERVLGILDNNANLHGKTLGRHRIAPARPAIEQGLPAPLLISSFLGQNGIARSLPPGTRHHLLYPDAP